MATNLQHRAASPGEENRKPQFIRRLGFFDATMLVMGGIIGAGIFMNPHVVATILHTP